MRLLPPLLVITALLGAFALLGRDTAAPAPAEGASPATGPAVTFERYDLDEAALRSAPLADLVTGTLLGERFTPAGARCASLVRLFAIRDVRGARRAFHEAATAARLYAETSMAGDTYSLIGVDEDDAYDIPATLVRAYVVRDATALAGFGSDVSELAHGEGGPYQVVEITDWCHDPRPPAAARAQ